jgi:integrase
MATIRKRGSSWQAQVRREGYPPLSKSFASKSDALAWSRDKERAIDRGELPLGVRELKGLSVRDLLLRYSETVTPTKRGAGPEQYRIRTILRHELAQVALSRLSPAAIAQYRDDRLQLVQPGTVRRELAILQHCLEMAKREWGVPIPANPVRQITLPEAQRPRERRLAEDEGNRLTSAATASAWYLHPLISLAIETGMRRGELLSIRWKDIDLSTRTIRVLKTKNGYPRTVPLTPGAIHTLSVIAKTEDRVFPVTPNAVRLAWERLRRRIGLEDLRLHDLRHEAVSRFFEAGLNVPEVALISGHRDPRMLFRYTHPRPELVAEKLAAGERNQNVGVLPRSASGTD